MSSDNPKKYNVRWTLFAEKNADYYSTSYSCSHSRIWKCAQSLWAVVVTHVCIITCRCSRRSGVGLYIRVYWLDSNNAVHGSPRSYTNWYGRRFCIITMTKACRLFGLKFVVCVRPTRDFRHSPRVQARDFIPYRAILSILSVQENADRSFSNIDSTVAKLRPVRINVFHSRR